MATRRCIARGRVQGVGFRHFVLRTARELGVTGTVRNRADGTLEAVLQADSAEALDRMEEKIRQGPPPARVEAVEVEAVERTEGYDRMAVVR